VVGREESSVLSAWVEGKAAFGFVAVVGHIWEGVVRVSRYY
jgi:hypothetical protein